jgi:hypothetical protein
MVTKKFSKKTSESEVPARLFYIFYNQERWKNWLKILSESDFSSGDDSEEIPEGYRVLDEFSDDITLAAIKIIRLYQNGRISLEDARTKLYGVEEIVMGELPESEITEIVRSIQVSMLVLFASGRKYLNNVYLENENIKNFVKNGRKIFEKDPENALDIASSIGATVINGASCCGKYVKETNEPTLFDEWLVEIERISDAMKSLKYFDEEVGDVQ